MKSIRDRWIHLWHWMRHSQRGQSLVEFIFFLPALLILLAGIVEVGGVLNAKLTVVNSAREGARFGAAGSSDEDITAATQTATSSMFAYQDDNADIYVIHAKTNDSGTIANSCPANRTDAESFWCVRHTVGDGPGMPSFVTREQVESELSDADIEVVGVAVVYDHQAILGLPFLKGLADVIPANSFTMMRIESQEKSSPGCAVYPMGVSTDIVNWPTGYPKYHQLPDILIGGGAGTFGWLSWNGEVNTPNLRDNLGDPTNSIGNYTNSRDPDDHDLNVGDWIWASTGWVQAVTDDVDVLQDRYIRIVVFDRIEGTGSNTEIRVAGYAIVQINGSMSPSDKTLRAEFIRFDTSCK